MGRPRRKNNNDLVDQDIRELVASVETAPGFSDVYFVERDPVDGLWRMGMQSIDTNESRWSLNLNRLKHRLKKYWKHVLSLSLVVIMLVLVLGKKQRPIPTTNDPLYAPEKATTSIVSESSGNEYQVSELSMTQINNYRAGTALILQIHIMHDDPGSALCDTIGHANGDLDAPPEMCRLDLQHDRFPFEPSADFPFETPWNYSDTHSSILKVRKHFSFVSWAFDRKAPELPLRTTNWEDDNLLSVIVMRHPIVSRFQAHLF
jgi:hypothetical protein